MAKTFEALMKAEKENQIKPEQAKVFDLKPKHKPHIPSNFNISPQVVEEYHRMKHHILSTNHEGKVKALLFSSSTAGEGNSTVLINFAITLASGGDKVLLVDANLRNPTLHDLFNVEIKGGLTELLLENNTLKDVIKRTQIKNLSVITGGIPHSNPFSVFESQSLDSFIGQMKAQADWVLFDSPPIHSYNDSSTLAAKMDGVVMVVQAEKTRWEVAQSAKERIGNSKVKILGVILNKRKLYIPGWAYKIL
jgi:capsular exopolysaccharide synthesis family protein